MLVDRWTYVPSAKRMRNYIRSGSKHRTQEDAKLVAKASTQNKCRRNRASPQSVRVLACGKHDVCVQSPVRPRYHNCFKDSVSWSFLVLSPSQLPHEEHAATFASFTLRPRCEPDRGLRSRVARHSRPRSIVHLRRARSQLARRAEPSASKLSHKRRI